MSLGKQFYDILEAEWNDWLDELEDNLQSARQSPQNTLWDDFFWFFREGYYEDTHSGNSSQEDSSQQSRKSQDKGSYQRDSYNSRRTYQNRGYHYRSSYSKSYGVNPEARFYQALEIPIGADFEEIKLAYKKVIKKYHPDRFAQDPEKQQAALQLSQKINEAYAYFRKKHGK